MMGMMGNDGDGGNDGNGGSDGGMMGNDRE